MKLFFLLLLLVPAALGFDCSYFSNTEECEEITAVNEDLLANLIYTNYSHPDHSFIQEHNVFIEVNDSPLGYEKVSEEVIRDAWLAMLTIEPSMWLNDTRYCPSDFTIRSEYDYWIKVPDDYYNNNRRHGDICKILYYLHEEEATLTKYADNQPMGEGKTVEYYNFQRDAVWKDQLDIHAVIRNDHYLWERYCCNSKNGRCVRYCWRCPYEYRTYTPHNLRLTDEKQTTYWNHEPTAEFTLTAEYKGTTKAKLENDNKTNLWVELPQSNYTQQNYEYTANFTKKPFYLLELVAKPISYEKGQNLLWNNNTFYTSNAQECSITKEDFFKTQTTQCTEEYTEIETEELEKPESSTNIIFLLKLGVFFLILWFIYKALKTYWGKLPGMIGILLMTLPLVAAEEECGLTNLASCIPEKTYDFIITLINAPLTPLLNLIKALLESPPAIELFQPIWAIIIYALSLFYGLLFLYAGYQFLFSGHNVIKREMAKEWLKNTVIMIVLIQASFYLYLLMADLGAAMTSAVLSMVEEEFFLLTADNILNIGLEFLFVTTYALVLFITMLFLAGRYLVVAFGVIFFPIGIFCYFIPPLKSYGKLILNTLGMFIFVSFLAAIIILACSQLILIPLFENIKIVVMINCFLLVDFMFLLLAKHVISKTGISDGAENMAQAAKYIAMMV